MKNLLEGLLVLVIDDSKTVRVAAQALLKGFGAEVIMAEDGFSALSQIVDHRPDILLIDVMMPKLDGYQTCALVKNNAAYKNIPIVMLSSKDGLFDKAKGKIVGADAYLTKPFSQEEVILVLEKIINQPEENLHTVSAI